MEWDVIQWRQSQNCTAKWHSRFLQSRNENIPDNMKHHDYEQIGILIYKPYKKPSDSISTQTKEHEIVLFAITTRR